MRTAFFKKSVSIITIFIFCFFFLAIDARLFALEMSDDDILADVLWSEVMDLKPGERPSVGIALSGGGARGFAHVGLLDVLRGSGFPIDYVAGTSVGAVIGALYASDMKMDDIWNFGKETSSRKLSRDFKGLKIINLLFRDKLITPKYITAFIKKNLGAHTFESLKLPFACVAMDFKTGEKIIFNSGPVAIAVRASANLPGIFKPIEYKHRYLVDGGVVDFLPVDAAKLLGSDWILASVTDWEMDSLPKNVLFSLFQVIDIRGSLLSKQSQDDADFVVNHPAGNINTADFDRCIEAGEIGVIETNKILGRLKKAYITDAFPAIMEKL